MSVVFPSLVKHSEGSIKLSTGKLEMHTESEIHGYWMEGSRKPLNWVQFSLFFFFFFVGGIQFNKLKD